MDALIITTLYLNYKLGSDIFHSIITHYFRNLPATEEALTAHQEDLSASQQVPYLSDHHLFLVN